MSVVKLSSGGTKQALLLRTLARYIEEGTVDADHVVVSYTDSEDDVHLFKTDHTVGAQAHWILERVQQRMVLIENAGS